VESDKIAAVLTKIELDAASKKEYDGTNSFKPAVVGRVGRVAGWK
jgi:hypothetical protein